MWVGVGFIGGRFYVGRRLRGEKYDWGFCFIIVFFVGIVFVY